MIHILIADDHPIVLDGLEALVGRQADMRVVARCSRGDEVLPALRRYRPDILLLDIRMPGRNGLETLADMERERVGTYTILLTAELNAQQVVEAVRLGVRGILLKDFASELLVRCIRKVYGGEHWLETRMSAVALQKLAKRQEAIRAAQTTLTHRELEIVETAAGGLGNKEIADRLCISEGTVKQHLHNIYEKLSISSRAALLIYARDTLGFTGDAPSVTAGPRAAPGDRARADSHRR